MRSHRLLHPFPSAPRCAERTARILLCCTIVALLFGIWDADALFDRLTGQPRGSDALFRLSDVDCESVVKRALSQGADINARNELGFTPLILAVNAGQRVVVKTLLRHGADPTLKSPSGMSPAHFAIARDDPRMLQLLGDAGADLAEPFGDEAPAQLAARLHSRRVMPMLQAGAVALK